MFILKIVLISKKKPPLESLSNFLGSVHSSGFSFYIYIWFI